MKTHIFKVLFFAVIVLFAFNADASSCGFSRDLMQGTRGEDVRCLQQYLTNSGYGMSYPDGVFGPRTAQSVMLWQANYGLPAYGAFDSTSRAKYFELTGGYVGGQVLGSQFVWEDSEKERAAMRIGEAFVMIEDARDEIDDSNKNTSSAEDSLEEAEDDIWDAVIAFYVDQDYDEAYDKADDAFENAEDAFDDVDGGDGDENDAEDAIDDARDVIDDARDEINDADDDGADVDEAEDLLNDAEDTLDDAEDEFDDENYDDAEDLADEAIDLADEAIDAIDW
ncbi:MAG: peptidoglycan-binding domain-containing protein [Minisyncoccia bacterium]